MGGFECYRVNVILERKGFWGILMFHSSEMILYLAKERRNGGEEGDGMRG